MFGELNSGGKWKNFCLATDKVWTNLSATFHKLGVTKPCTHMQLQHHHRWRWKESSEAFPEPPPSLCTQRRVRQKSLLTSKQIFLWVEIGPEQSWLVFLYLYCVSLLASIFIPDQGSAARMGSSLVMTHSCIQSISVREGERTVPGRKWHPLRIRRVVRGGVENWPPLGRPLPSYFTPLPSCTHIGQCH